MDKNKVIKLIGVGATFIGAVASVASSWATNKQQDDKITEAAAKAVAEALKKETN